MSPNSESQTQWRILDLIKWTDDYLREKGFESPRTDVEWMLTHVLECKRVQLYADFEKPLTPVELQTFKGLLKQRLTHKPVQYIVGGTEFMGFPFVLNEAVLIPRPETELLVEHAVDWLRERPNDRRTVLDVGTGSGCIAVSLAKLVPEARVTGLDVSEDALRVARQNIEQNRMEEQVSLEQVDILTTDPPGEPVDLIVSNPPYIDPDEAESLAPEIREYEPAEALFTKGSGLAFYNRYAHAAKSWIREDGMLLCEIGGSHQAEPVADLFGDQGWERVEIRTDYNGKGRLLVAGL